MELVDKKTAAKHLNICPETLMCEQKAGRLIGFKIGGRWRFDLRDLNQYIEERRNAAALEAMAKRETAAKGKNIIHIKHARDSTPLDRVWAPGKKIADVCAANCK